MVQNPQELDLSLVGFYCKLCGTYIRNYDEPETCPHCHIPICSKCRSAGLCLNCFIHLKDKTRTSLKLIPIFFILIPILSLFLLLNDWFAYLGLNFFGFIMIGTASYMGHKEILKDPSRYFDPEWEKEIASPEYQELISENSARRYIPKDKREMLERIQSPSSSLEEQILLKQNSENDNELEIKIDADQNTEVEELESNAIDINYKLFDHPCPICGETIEFADFCPNCNIRFCPNCGEENSPYAYQCICGFFLPDLETEFLQKIHQNPT